MIGTLNIVLARKPLEGTLVQNCLTYGCGALNIDGCRLSGIPPSVPQPQGGSGTIYGFKNGTGRSGEMSQSTGRFPSNVILSHLKGCKRIGHAFTSHPMSPDGKESVDIWECEENCPVKHFPTTDKPSGRASGPTRGKLGTHGRFSGAKGNMGESRAYGDVGSVSRFFKQISECMENQ